MFNIRVLNHHWKTSYGKPGLVWSWD